ncbi:hypothetical protein DITRI_Ditri18aG0043400 [Diplodiscus trichospermus]
MVPKTESVVLEKSMHQVGVKHLMKTNSNLQVREMLISINIPIENFMKSKGFENACGDRGVVNELQEEEEEKEEDEHFDSMMNHNESETEKVIEKLRKVVVEGQNMSCPIYLEDFLVGKKATSMPTCSHVFHPVGVSVFHRANWIGFGINS